MIPPSIRAASHDFADRVHVFIDQVMRAALQVFDCRAAEVEAQVVVHRGKDFLEVNRPIFGVFAQTIGGANDLACPHPATGE